MVTARTPPSAPSLTSTVTSASMPCALRVAGYGGSLGRLRRGKTYVTPAVGTRDAIWLRDTGGTVGVTAPRSAIFGGATAFCAVAPSRVLPVAKAGPSPPAVVESRLRPTTRGGGDDDAGGGGGGSGFAGLGRGGGFVAGRGAGSGGGSVFAT